MKKNRTILLIAVVLTTCLIVTGYLLVYDGIDFDLGVLGMITTHFFGSLVNLMFNNSGDIDHINGYLFAIGQIIQFAVVFTFIYILASLPGSKGVEK